MKSNAVYNRSLFRQFGGNTDSINSSVMVFHPVHETGKYEGIITKNDKSVGEFIVDCKDEYIDSQADIDLSKFNPKLSTMEICCDTGKKTFNIRKEGYLVFFTSSGDDGYSVVLNPATGQQDRTPYSTKKLERGDIVLLLLVRPGEYQLNSPGKKSSRLSVEIPKKRNEFQHALQTAETIKLNENGFDRDSLTIAPGQGLVVHIEVSTNIFVKPNKFYETTSEKVEKGKFQWKKSDQETPLPERRKDSGSEADE